MNIAVTIVIVSPFANGRSDRSLTRNGARNRPRRRSVDRHVPLQRVQILAVGFGTVDAPLLRAMFGVFDISLGNTSL